MGGGGEEPSGKNRGMLRHNAKMPLNRGMSHKPQFLPSLRASCAPPTRTRQQAIDEHFDRFPLAMDLPSDCDYPRLSPLVPRRQLVLLLRAFSAPRAPVLRALVAREGVAPPERKPKVVRLARAHRFARHATYQLLSSRFLEDTLSVYFESNFYE